MSVPVITVTPEPVSTAVLRHLPTPCERDPDRWDVDQGGLTDWVKAIRGCIACPLKQACWEERNRLYSENHPAGVIWAGTLYTDDGEPLTTGEQLLRHATKLLRERKRDRVGLLREVA